MAAFFLWPISDRVLGAAVPVGFLFSILGSVMGAMASPATIATGQSLAEPSMRATAHAIWTMAANLVGMGVGPLLAGWLSETLSVQHGDQAIRYSLVMVSGVAAPAAVALWIAARTIRSDLRRPDSR